MARLLVSLIKQIWALNIFNAVIDTLVTSVYYSDLIFDTEPSDKAKFWFRLFIMPISWTVNFITALALLFLFFKLGKKASKKERRPTQYQFEELAKKSM